LAASTPEVRAAALVAVAIFLGPGLLPASAQILADPVLSGRVLLGDSVLSSGTVVLHRVAPELQGEVDSTAVGRDGSFSFRLPSVPDPGRSEVYFASVRHAGVLYFGSAVALAVQLDSVYEIRTYDTLLAPSEGMSLPIQARNVFLEEEDDGWRVTDLVQVRNEEPRTLVARDGGVVWRYPLPPGARDPTVVQGGFGMGAVEFEGGDMVVRAALPPGEQIFPIQYSMPDPFLSLPLPGVTEALAVLVREPAPPLEAAALTAAGSVELEPGTTYRHFTASGLTDQVVRFTRGTRSRPPPVRWMAVILGLVLAAVGLWAVQGGRGAPGGASVGRPLSRRALLVQIALLDEEFEARSPPSPEERGAYAARRGELLRRLRGAR
jgi:hypothetical protein